MMQNLEGTMHVKLYAISTCGWCKKTKRFLEDHGVEYDCTDVDLLESDQKEAIREQVGRFNPRRSFPTLVVDEDAGKVVVGFNEERLREVLGL
jgi:glutaredoxin